MPALFAARACARGAGAPGCNFNVRLCNGRRRKAIVLHRSASFAYVAMRTAGFHGPEMLSVDLNSIPFKFLGASHPKSGGNLIFSYFASRFLESIYAVVLSVSGRQPGVGARRMHTSAGLRRVYVGLRGSTLAWRWARWCMWRGIT